MHVMFIYLFSIGLNSFALLHTLFSIVVVATVFCLSLILDFNVLFQELDGGHKSKTSYGEP